MQLHLCGNQTKCTVPFHTTKDGHVLIPGTHGHLTRKRGIYKCGCIKDLEVGRLPWLTFTRVLVRGRQEGPSAISNVIMEAERERSWKSERLEDAKLLV